MECLRKLFSSCTNPKKTQIKENQISPTPVSERTLNITPNLNNTSFTTPAIQQSNILTKVPSSKSLARVNSHKDTALIQSTDFRMKENKSIKYNCPICLKYYDAILITKCCGNYICHFCIEMMNEKTLLEEKKDVTNCPFCEVKSLVMDDVDPKDQPKRYSDSPSSTFGGGKPFFKEKFSDLPKDKIDFYQYSQRQTKHKYSKSINSNIASLSVRRMSEGNIMPDFFSTADNRESVSITETIPKEKAKRGSYLSQNEEEINIISGRKLRSALLPNWSHRSPIPQVENIEDIQHSQI